MEDIEVFETYNDYPKSASNNACKVLRWRDEHGDEVKGMTRVGWTRANQLCKKEKISCTCNTWSFFGNNYYCSSNLRSAKGY